MKKTITFTDAKELALHINKICPNELEGERAMMKALKNKSVTGIYALTIPMDNAELALTRELECLKSVVKDILEFAMHHGTDAAKSAVFHGAFNDHIFLGNIVFNFVHPRDEVREFTPAWILQAFVDIVA